MKTLEKQSKASMMKTSPQRSGVGSKRNQAINSAEVSDFDLLRHLQVVLQGELTELQERQTRIFTWSTYIFLFVIGGLFVTNLPLPPLWSNRGILATSIVSAALLLVVAFSIRWHQRAQTIQVEVVETQTKIEKLLHCYDKEYYGSLEQDSLYPKRWAKSKNIEKRVSFGNRVFNVNYVSVTALLGIFAVAMLWIP